MASKKKLIRIEPAEGLYTDSPYAPKVSSNMTFAFASPSEELRDGVKFRKQISTFFSCREQLCEVPRQVLHKHETIGGMKLKRDTIDMTRLRLLVAVRATEDSKQRIFSAKRVINILEEAAGWDKSVITSIKHTHYKDDMNQIFLFTGPEQWVRVPQMLSLVTLILRCGFKFGPFEATDIKEVDALFKKLAKTSDKRQSDHDYISETRKHMVKLMKRIDKVFNKGSERYYSDPKSQATGWTGYGGISSLFKCSSGNETLHKNLRKYVLDAKQ